MISLSKCHQTAAAVNTAVARARISKVEWAGRRFARTDCTMTQTQPANTASEAMRMAHGVALANQLTTPPPTTSTAAGRANGNTQQMPQASAPVAARAADAPTILSVDAVAVLQPRGSWPGVVE